MVRCWLGPVRRAGQGVPRHGTPGGEAGIFLAAGVEGPERLVIPASGPLLREVDDIVAWVWSRSDSAPRLFVQDRAAFEAELRSLLADASKTGVFTEPAPGTEVFIWRTPDTSTAARVQNGPEVLPPGRGMIATAGWG